MNTNSHEFFCAIEPQRRDERSAAEPQPKQQFNREWTRMNANFFICVYSHLFAVKSFAACEQFRLSQWREEKQSRVSAAIASLRFNWLHLRGCGSAALC